VSLEATIAEAEFSRFINANPTETNRRKIWDAAWKEALKSACRRDCFCRNNGNECCYCGRRKGGQ
jgi:hypothetical protein